MVGPARAWSAPLPGRGDRWRSAAPALLLAAVAVLGVRNHMVRDQSSWQGASFGMFATYDNDSSRVVTVLVDGGEGPRRVRLPASMDDDVLRLKVVPTDGGAEALARRVLELVEGPAEVQVAVRAVVLGRGDPLVLSHRVIARGEARR